MNLSVEIAGVKFKNPVIAASGTFNFGREYAGYYDISLLGGISVKGLTREPREGNPPPRIAETYGGILNSVGLQNPGIEYFIKYDLEQLKRFDTVIIANIAGNTVEDYRYMAERLSDTSVDMLELNISCPNVKAGGVQFGVIAESVYKVTYEVKKNSRKPLIVKLTPNTSDISATAKAAEEGGADAVSLINTLTGMAIDIKTRRPVLSNITGGLSGPAIKPVALRMVYEAYKSVKIPVIGMGGIMNGDDAVEFMLAGAAAVQIGTANIINVSAMPEIISGLEKYLKDNKIEDVNKLTGALII
ncbi:MAG: dihydroorotate dehydrogenase [Christensenellales bacterium]|jgi:dihydroorotate dehydrogenase (NAD+) catalytic subunit